MTETRHDRIVAEDQRGGLPPGDREPMTNQASIGHLMRSTAHALLSRASGGVWVTEEDIPNEPALALAGILYDLERRGIQVDLPEVRALDEALADADAPRAYSLRQLIALRSRLSPPPARPLAIPDLVGRPITRREAIAVGRLIQKAAASGRADADFAAAELADHADRAGMSPAELVDEIAAAGEN